MTFENIPQFKMDDCGNSDWSSLIREGCIESIYEVFDTEEENEVVKAIIEGTLSQGQIEELIESWICYQECFATARYLVSKTPIKIKNVQDALEQIPNANTIKDVYGLKDDSDDEMEYFYCTMTWGPYYIAEIYTTA